MLRLRDDPDFQKRTGMDLAKDAAQPSVEHLASLQARVVVAASAAAVPAAVSAWVVASVLAVGAGGSALGWMAHGAWATEAPTVLMAPSPVPIMVQTPDAAPAPVKEEPRQEAPAVVRARPTKTTAPQHAPPPVVPTPAVAAPAMEKPPARGALAEQVRVYESGRTALLAGDGSVALREFDAYLGAYPAGALADEAAAARVDALVLMGQWERAVEAAEPLFQRDLPAPARARLFTQAAWALAQLGRCTRARALMGQAKHGPSAAWLGKFERLCPLAGSR